MRICQWTSECVLGMNRVNCQSTYRTIGIFANSICRPLLQKPRRLYESVEGEHQAAQITPLIGVREGTVLLPGIDNEEVDRLLEVLCCDTFDS